MSDLMDEGLQRLLNGNHHALPDAQLAVARELQRHRAAVAVDEAVAADEERVRSVIGAAAMEEYPDLTNDACMRVAARAAKQLATSTMRLSDDERGVVSRMVGRVYELVPMGNGDEAALGALLDRLLSTGAKP